MEKDLKNNTVFSFMIRYNIWISLIAVSNVAYFQLLYYERLYSIYLALVGTCTLFVYNFHRYLKRFDFTAKKIPIKGRLIYWLLGIGILVLFVLLLLDTSYTELRFYFPVAILLFCIAVALTFAYLVPIHLKFPLISSGWNKPLSLAGIWFLIVAIIPGLHWDKLWEFRYLLGHFLLVLTGICIVFDIKDMEADKAKNITTIANRFGSHRTKQIGIFLVFLSLVLLVVSWQNILFYFLLGAISLGSILSISLIRKQTPDTYYYLIMDGLLGLFLLAYLAG